jgi:large repetitive protein
VSFSVINPQGGSVPGQGCTPGAGARCGLSLVNLVAGDYLATVVANPQVNFTFRVTPAVTGLLPLNAPFNLSLPNPGQFAMLSFVATQGQTLNLQVDSIVTTPSQSMHIAVRDPSGVEISSSPPGTYTNLNAGTYTVQLSPYYGGIATARILLSGAVERPTDGTSANFSNAEPGLPLRFSFNAIAGENIGIGLWNLTVGTASGAVSMGITTPSGGSLPGTTCSGSPAGGVCGLSLRNLPQTGRYEVRLVPNQTTMSFTLAFTHAVNNALTIGVPFNLSLPVHGQFAMLTFSASAGQSLTMDVASIVTNPGQPVYVAVYNSNNQWVADISPSNSGALSLPNLAAGTYKIQLTPYYGGTASAVVRVY